MHSDERVTAVQAQLLVDGGIADYKRRQRAVIVDRHSGQIDAVVPILRATLPVVVAVGRAFKNLFSSNDLIAVSQWQQSHESSVVRYTNAPAVDINVRAGLGDIALIRDVNACLANSGVGSPARAPCQGHYERARVVFRLIVIDR